MGNMPGRMYKKITQHAFTRREYMGGVPNPRITQFVQGNKNRDFPVELTLTVDERCQIRHTALESARIAANRLLEKKAGLNDYKLTVTVYPHHVLRQNKQATGAGADRVSQGMRRAYGKEIGTAARVKVNQKVMILETVEKNIELGREALGKAASKLPTPCKIIVGGEFLGKH